MKLVWSNFNFGGSEKEAEALLEEWYKSLQVYSATQISLAFEHCKTSFNRAPTIKDFIDAIKKVSADKGAPTQSQFYCENQLISHCDYKKYLEKSFGSSAANEYQREYDIFLSMKMSGQESLYQKTAMQRLKSLCGK